jgi:hypothetical protein
MEISSELAKGLAMLDQLQAQTRDQLADVPTKARIDALLALSKTRCWETSLLLINTGPQWLRVAACMATMLSLSESIQRSLEAALLQEETPNGENE